MDKDTRDQVDRLAQCASELSNLVSRDEVALVRFGNHKAVMICGVCEGAFTVHTDGIRCRNCGLVLAVRWPRGTAPSAAVLRVYLLEHGAELFGLDDKAA